METGVTIVDDEVGEFNIPSWVNSLATFRKWSDEDEELDFGRVGYLKGKVWVDMSREQLYAHNAVKTELTIAIGGLVKRRRLGRYFSDGVLMVNAQADIGGQPDGMFVSFDSLRTGRCRDVPGRRDGGFTEIEGSPDIVIEVVSPGTVRKDTVRLREAYWEAGIQEYWLIDARREPIRFELLRHAANGYVAVRRNGGWLKSGVLDQAFRWISGQDERGRPEFTLDIR